MRRIAVGLLLLCGGVVLASAGFSPVTNNGSIGNGFFGRYIRMPLMGGDPALLRILPTTSLPSSSGDCDGAAVVGTRGEVVTETRTAVGYCQRSDGVLVELPAATPRVTARGWYMTQGPLTNLLLWNRDWTNPVWTATNMTATLTSSGRTGITNSATVLTATAANATITQGITRASNLNQASVSVRRLTGTGNVQMTRDGAAFTTLTSSRCKDPVTRAATAINSSTWVVCGLQTTSTNPIDGIRLVTSGDSIEVDLFFDANSGVATSTPIATQGTAVASSVDQASTPQPAAMNTAAGCWAAHVECHANYGLDILTSPGGGALQFGDYGGSRFVEYDTGQAHVATTSAFTSVIAPNPGADVIGTWSTADGLMTVRRDNGTAATAVYTNGMARKTSLWISSGSTGDCYYSNIRMGTTTTACDQ
jgi:hypothetical protein